MALMFCRECGKQVSSEAPSCPHCGVPRPVLTEEDWHMEQLAHGHGVVDYARVKPSFNPGIAAVLSFFIPGAGQIYRGKIAAGLLWFIFTAAGYAMLIVPGIFLHLLCIFNAASRG